MNEIKDALKALFAMAAILPFAGCFFGVGFFTAKKFMNRIYGNTVFELHVMQKEKVEDD